MFSYLMGTIGNHFLMIEKRFLISFSLAVKSVLFLLALYREMV